MGEFFALQHALYINTFLLVASGAFYLWASFHVVEDHHKAKLEMGGGLLAFVGLVELDYGNF